MIAALAQNTSLKALYIAGVSLELSLVQENNAFITVR